MPAPQIFNPGNRGQNARYDISGLAWDPERGAYVDDAGYHYDSNGLSLDRPDTFVEGLRGADDMNGWTPGMAAPSGGGGGGGSSIFGNPYFQQYQSSVTAADAADLSDTKSQIQQLLIQFGLVPGNYKDKLGALDDTIRQLIEKNTKSGISQYARLLEGKDDIRRETIGRLSSKGLLRSGSKGYRLRRNQLDYDRTLSDSLSAVLGNANQLQSGYAGRASSRQQGLASFLEQLFSSWRPSGGGGVAAPTAPRTVAAPQYQTPVYAPAASQPNVPFFQVQPGKYMAGGVLRASEGLF